MIGVDEPTRGETRRSRSGASPRRSPPAPSPVLSALGASTATVSSPPRRPHRPPLRLALRRLRERPRRPAHANEQLRLLPRRRRLVDRRALVHARSLAADQIAYASSRYAVGGVAGSDVRAVIVRLTKKGTVWATLRRGTFYAAVPRSAQRARGRQGAEQRLAHELHGHREPLNVSQPLGSPRW